MDDGKQGGMVRRRGRGRGTHEDGKWETTTVEISSYTIAVVHRYDSYQRV